MRNHDEFDEEDCGRTGEWQERGRSEQGVSRVVRCGRLVGLLGAAPRGRRRPAGALMRMRKRVWSLVAMAVERERETLEEERAVTPSCACSAVASSDCRASSAPSPAANDAPISRSE